jgi:hypothetical protein
VLDSWQSWRILYLSACWMTITQRLGMLTFSPFILQGAIQKLKHNHGTASVSYHSTYLLWAKPKYVQCFITRIFGFIQVYTRISRSIQSTTHNINTIYTNYMPNKEINFVRKRLSRFCRTLCRGCKSFLSPKNRPWSSVLHVSFPRRRGECILYLHSVRSNTRLIVIACLIRLRNRNTRWHWVTDVSLPDDYPLGDPTSSCMLG